MGKEPVTLTVYTTEGCSLCEETLAQVRRESRGYPVRIQTVEILGDPELEARYRESIPVVCLDGREISRGLLDIQALRQNLRALRPSRGKGLPAQGRLPAVAATLAVVATVHWMVDPHKALLHGILGHLYLIPILLSSFWFGLKGGLATAVLSSLLYAPHLLLLRGPLPPAMAVYNYLEILLYLLIGTATGILSENERKQRENYQHALETLQVAHEKLKAQADQLLSLERQLWQADRLSALGELAAGLAHEIRNPLGSIKGTAEILGDAIPPDDPRAEFPKILLNEVNRLNRIVEEFLQYARPAQPSFQPCQINGVLKAVVSLIARQAERSGVKCQIRFDPELEETAADPVLLKQAFLNVVLNAIQAMPQ